MNNHLGHRLSALIDGELDDESRDRVLVHLARCESCRGDAIALRTLKRRMNALGETEADSSLTGRLMGLAGLAGGLDSPGSLPLSPWSALAAGPAGGRFGGWPEARPAWFVVGGAVTVFLAGLGTAAFMAGGSPSSPEPRVTPAVGLFMAQHDMVSGERPAATVGGIASRSPAPATGTRPAAPGP